MGLINRKGVRHFKSTKYLNPARSEVVKYIPFFVCKTRITCQTYTYM
jgi:hypothetical protein